MVNWFYEFLYSISRTIFRIIDGLMMCANKLCGIDDITIDGKSEDFLTYLFRSEKISFAFKVASLIGIIVLVFFTIYAIIRSITKEKPEGTPGQICFKAVKALLMFLFVPAVMLATIYVGNTIMMALYKATSYGASGIGNFLFGTFAGDGGMDATNVQKFLDGVYDYNNVDLVWECMDLSNFSFVFSWLAGGVVLFSLGASMFMFVDRVISIVILYIVAPFSISTYVIDDGTHFKLWRDQILVKFFTGYGAIIALNVYMLIVGLALNPSLVFFPDSSLGNMVMKLLLIGGGALTLKKSMALIGNLVSSGAGSTELRDNALTGGGLARMAKGLAGSALGGLATLTGAKAAKSIVNDAMSAKSRDLGEKLLKKMGIGIADNRTREGEGGNEDAGSDSQNSERPTYGDGNSALDAISNIGDVGLNRENENNIDNDNANHNQINNNLLDNSLNNIDINNDNRHTGAMKEEDNEWE